MGYGMSQNESKFRIYASNKVPALLAIKALMAEKKDAFSWVKADTIKRWQALADAMKAWRWNVEEDGMDSFGNRDEDIISITFLGEKAGDDLDLFKAIAPFVVSGSYIEMHGEDGAHWRWFFTENTCVEKKPKISWD